MKHSLILILILIPSIALAQTVAPPGIVRVYVHEDKDCLIDTYGSGFLVSPTQAITNYHVIQDRRNNCSIQLRFFDGARVSARVIKWDKVWDLALLGIQAVKYEHLKLGKRPFEGQIVTIHGCGPDYEYRVLKGMVGKTNLSPNVEGYRNMFDLMQVRGAPSRRGDSGGPILDSNGLVVGVLNCTDNKSTGGIMIDRVLKVFKRELASIKSKKYQLGDE